MPGVYNKHLCRRFLWVRRANLCRYMLQCLNERPADGAGEFLVGQQKSSDIEHYISNWLFTILTVDV